MVLISWTSSHWNSPDNNHLLTGTPGTLHMPGPAGKREEDLVNYCWQWCPVSSDHLWSGHFCMGYVSDVFTRFKRDWCHTAISQHAQGVLGLEVILHHLFGWPTVGSSWTHKILSKRVSYCLLLPSEPCRHAFWPQIPPWWYYVILKPSWARAGWSLVSPLHFSSFEPNWGWAQTQNKPLAHFSFSVPMPNSWTFILLIN